MHRLSYICFKRVSPLRILKQITFCILNDGKERRNILSRQIRSGEIGIVNER